MYSKLTTFVLMAAMAAVLITSATLAMADDADAERKKKRGQNSAQVNNCDSGKCQSASSQIQGKGNSVVIIQNQD